MSYLINKSDGSTLTTIEDNVLDTTTSLGLVGRNYIGYGEIQNENFVFLLENFAGENPPARPVKGQAWYDSKNSKLNVYNGSDWVPVGAATSSDTPPVEVLGSFWLKSSTKQLYVFTGNGWTLIGPEGVENFGKTKAESLIVTDVLSNLHAVIALTVNDTVISITSSEQFTLGTVPGFSEIKKGINVSSSSILKGDLDGNAYSATRLKDLRTINGTVFDGTQNIVITSQVPNSLTPGDYITGSAFDGSSPNTWNINASTSNVIGTVVARDSAGDFSANKITAVEFIGLHRGNVDVASGTSTFDKIICTSLEGANFSGNAASANKLSPGKKINGITFDGTVDVTVPAAANTLTGDTLSSNVINSFLTSVGTLNSLTVSNPGITVGTGTQVKLSITNNEPILEDTSGRGLRIAISDSSRSGGKASIKFNTAEQSLLLGGTNHPSILPAVTEDVNLGSPLYKFFNVYAGTFRGIATSAQYADLAEKYLADNEYEPGTVLEFGGVEEVTLAEDETRKVAGVVTTNPGFIMNNDLEGKFVVSIALQGRVPCKVRGKINKGDMLISGGNGYARPTNDPKIGTIIGKSLEDFNGVSGIIEIAVGRL